MFRFGKWVRRAFERKGGFRDGPMIFDLNN